LISNITPTSFQLNGELIDLIPLEIRINLLCDGKTIHAAKTFYCILLNLHFFSLRGDIISEERQLRMKYYFDELNILLNKAGV